MKKIIKKVHKYAITPPKKDGDRWSTYVIEKGKRKKVTRNTESDLETFLLEFYADEVSATYTVREVYEHYRASRKELLDKGSISAQTYAYDESNWNRFLADKEDFINMPIKEVKAIHIERLCKSLTGDGILSKKAFDKLKSLVNGVFDEAVLMGALDYSTSRGCLPAITKKLKFTLKEIKDGEETEKDVYSKEDIEKLRAYLRTLPESTYTLAIEFATYFFMRLGELRALTWEDYDKEHHRLFIWHEITKESRNGKARCDIDTPHTKGAKESGRRYVPVPPRAEEILEKMYSKNGKKKYIFNGFGNASFSIPENKFNEHLRAYCEEAGIKYRSSHKFRFYGISACYESGVDEQYIQYLAGHSTPEMTRHYNRSRISNADSSAVVSILN